MNEQELKLMDMLLAGFIMFLPFLISLSILAYLEHEPKRDDLPPKLWEYESVTDRLYWRDIEPLFRAQVKIIKRYFQMRMLQVKDK